MGIILYYTQDVTENQNITCTRNYGHHVKYAFEKEEQKEEQIDEDFEYWIESVKNLSILHSRFTGDNIHLDSHKTIKQPKSRKHHKPIWLKSGKYN